MGKMDNNSKQEPFHSGEIYNLWNFLFGTKGYLVTLQVLNNHADDKDFKNFLDDITENSFKQEEQQVEAILKDAGIRLPPAPPDRPNVEVQDIPAGARFNDPEIAILVQKELLAGKLYCSYISGISTHEDIQTLFNDFHSQKMEYEQKLLQLTTDKGWHISPPVNIK